MEDTVKMRRGYSQEKKHSNRLKGQSRSRSRSRSNSNERKKERRSKNKSKSTSPDKRRRKSDETEVKRVEKTKKGHRLGELKIEENGNLILKFEEKTEILQEDLIILSE